MDHRSNQVLSRTVSILVHGDVAGNTGFATTEDGQAHHHRLLGKRWCREVVCLYSTRTQSPRPCFPSPRRYSRCRLDGPVYTPHAWTRRTRCPSEQRRMGSGIRRYSARRRAEVGMHERGLLAEEGERLRCLEGSEEECDDSSVSERCQMGRARLSCHRYPARSVNSR